MLREKDGELAEQVQVSSAGFIPQKLKEQLAYAHIAFPEPFYSRPMAEATRGTLAGKGMAVSAGWRSKALSPHMVKTADLMITALPEQKDDLIRLYRQAQFKIFTTREMSQWDGYLVFEDLTGLPMDDTYWDYVEENPVFVSKVLSETEEALVRAYPSILKQLGVRE